MDNTVQNSSSCKCNGHKYVLNCMYGHNSCDSDEEDYFICPFILSCRVPQVWQKGSRFSYTTAAFLTYIIFLIHALCLLKLVTSSCHKTTVMKCHSCYITFFISSSIFFLHIQTSSTYPFFILFLTSTFLMSVRLTWQMLHLIFQLLFLSYNSVGISSAYC